MKYEGDPLAFEMPVLIGKLVKERVADSAEEGLALFLEVKRYLVLSEADSTRQLSMFSSRIDAVWHQFILFSRIYTDYCESFFGRYIHHTPDHTAESESGSPQAGTFEEFREFYEEYFKRPLSALWFDKNTITRSRRVMHYRSGGLRLFSRLGMPEVILETSDPPVAMDERTRSALLFVARTGAFYVRELPGDLGDEEKTSLIAALVDARVLRIAN